MEAYLLKATLWLKKRNKDKWENVETLKKKEKKLKVRRINREHASISSWNF